MNLQFYQDLLPIDQFETITDQNHFRAVPEDWVVILSDIRSSTQAIESGRYREVNLIGAATIAAIQNVIGTRHFPFVFGGDGATVLLPSALTKDVIPALQKLQAHSSRNFKLDLRVGVVPLFEVYKRGGRVLLAKYQLSTNNFLAMFRGGGLQLAETLLKKDPKGSEFLLAPAEDLGSPGLGSLSCRWAPIQNRNGTMVSVLIQALDFSRSGEVYKKILDELNPIFYAEENRPASLERLKLEKFGANLRRELKLRQDLSWFGVLRRILFPMIYSRLCLWLPFFPGTERFRTYMGDCSGNSDYKKLDDYLRMILDCSRDQAMKLEALLRRHHAANEINYGIHYSDSALMTCVVDGMGVSDHVHFIDGGNGGYTMAAKGLKLQSLARAKAASSAS